MTEREEIKGWGFICVVLWPMDGSDWGLPGVGSNSKKSGVWSTAGKRVNFQRFTEVFL